ncbi:hypothetical protein Tco_0285559 [Tanacetum coccineum]
MADLTFADSHNMVAYLEKSEDNADFAEIVDFLNASPIRFDGGCSKYSPMELSRSQELERTACTWEDSDEYYGKLKKLKKRVKKLESKKKSRTPQLKRRLFKVRIESSVEKSLGDQEDASKQGRNEIDQDEGISWFQEDSETQGRRGALDCVLLHRCDLPKDFLRFVSKKSLRFA